MFLEDHHAAFSDLTTVLVNGNLLDPSDYLQADFTFLLGASFADPDHAAALEVGRVVIENNLNHLAAFELESPTQSATFLLGIEDETGKPFWPTVRIDD